MKIREIVVDTETTGLNHNHGDRLVEIACVELVNKMLTGNIFHSYLKIPNEISDIAFDIHGISHEFLQDKPSFQEISDSFLSFIADSKLIAHNAQFDIGFINSELNICNLPSISAGRIVDTLSMARIQFPNSQVSLNHLCRKFKINSNVRSKHGALLDAKLLSSVYIKLVLAKQEKITFTDAGCNINKYRTTPHILNRKFHLSQLEIMLHNDVTSKLLGSSWSEY